MAPVRGTPDEGEEIRGQIQRLRWLIALRWVGLAWIGVIGLTTQLAGYARMEYLWGWALAPVALAYNTAFWYWLGRTEETGGDAQQVERSLRWQRYLSALCDTVVLNALVYLNGGVECPMLFILFTAVILNGLHLPGAGIFILANLGAALFTLTAVGEFNGWIPHVPFLRPQYGHELYLDQNAVLSRVLSLTAGLNLIAFLMYRLGQKLNQAESRTRDLLGRLRRQVGEAARRVAGDTSTIRHGAEEVSHVAEQIATTVQQIAQGAGQQASQLETLSRNLEHLADAARRMAEGTTETHQVSEEAVATTDQGRQAALEATARMEEIARVFAQTEEALAGLARRSEEIAEVAAAIDRFAERTDLLALNAGIEAARAGEHGRGFAVVASEVKKLAASSSTSAERVAEMVAQIQAEITGVVHSVQAGEERVQDGQRSISTLQGVLDGMAAVITRTDELVATMEHLSRQQREAHREIVRAVGEIASTAEQTAAGAEETAAAVEQQAASFAEFGQTVQDLVGLATQLDQAVANLYAEAANHATPVDAGQTPGG